MDRSPLVICAGFRGLPTMKDMSKVICRSNRFYGAGIFKTTYLVGAAVSAGWETGGNASSSSLSRRLSKFSVKAS